MARRNRRRDSGDPRLRDRLWSLQGGNPAAAEKDNAKLYELPKAVPSSLEQGRLRLLHQGHALYVGDDQSRIFDIFGPPPGASDVADLPEGWDQDHYRVKGWEKGKDAFGAIIVKDNVALAMFTSEGKSPLEFKAILNDYDDVLGEPTLKIDGVMSYRFWNSKTQRLMVSSVRLENDTYRITQAVGAFEVMDALRMSETAARADILKAASLTAKQTP